jgi:hypothetical protein
VIGDPILASPPKDEQTASSTTSTPTFPAVRAGDYLGMWGWGSGASATAFTNPAGWTQDAQAASTTNTLLPDVYAAHKSSVAGTESGTQSVTHSLVVTTMGMAAIPGAAQTPDVAPVLNDTGASQTAMTWSAMTVLTPGSMLVVVAGGNSSTVTVSSLTVNSVAGVVLLNRAVASARSGGVAYFRDLPVGSTGSIVLNWSATTRGIGYAYILRPTLAVTEQLTPTPRYF